MAFLRDLNNLLGLGFRISRLIMPSQDIDTAQSPLANAVADRIAKKDPILEKDLSISEPNLDSYLLSSHGAMIQFCEFQYGKPISAAKNTQKVIINAVGNSDLYENHIEEFIAAARNQYRGHKVVGFNYRNVGKSIGKPCQQQDWIDDIITLVEHYRKQGIPLENIVLIGESLSGSLCTIAAHQIYAKEKKSLKAQGKPANAKVSSVKVINVRSFATLADEIVQLLEGVGSGVVYGSLSMISGIYNSFSWSAPLFGMHPMLLAPLFGWTLMGHFFPKITQAVLRQVMGFVTWITFGTLDALSAYEALPQHSKDHIMVVNDAVIPKAASLHEGLKFNRWIRSFYSPVLGVLQYLNPLNWLKNCRNPEVSTIKAQIETHNAAQRTLRELELELCTLKDSTLRLGNDGAVISMQAHNLPLANLGTFHKYRAGNTTHFKEQINGQQVCDNKVERLFRLSPAGM